MVVIGRMHFRTVVIDDVQVFFVVPRTWKDSPRDGLAANAVPVAVAGEHDRAGIELHDGSEKRHLRRHDRFAAVIKRQRTVRLYRSLSVPGLIFGDIGRPVWCRWPPSGFCPAPSRNNAPAILRNPKRFLVPILAESETRVPFE